MPLLAISLSAAVTASLETHVAQRLEWLSLILSSIQLDNEDIADVAPKIMDVISQRLQGAYMNMAEANARDPLLKQVSNLTKQANEVRRLAG